MSKKLDIILFGATGFTGYRGIPILIQLAKDKNRNLSYAIAGRSPKKLEKALSEWESILGYSLSHIPIIQADVDDQKSLNLMARQARIILNCVGPFTIYGEPVIQACIDESTHYVDITAEQPFIDAMAIKYHQKAQEKNIFVISSCGVDVIPSDLGVVFLQQNFKGVLNSAELFIKVWDEKRLASGSLINRATWNSVIFIGSSWSFKTIFLHLIKTLTDSTSCSSWSPSIKQKIYLHTDPIEAGRMIYYPGNDRSLIEKSQRLLYENDKQRPAQAAVYYVAHTTKRFLGILITGIMFFFLTRIEFGRRLLQKYPHIFTFGLVAREPPSDAKTNNTLMSVTIRGKGWTTKLHSPDAQYTTAPNKTVIAQVKGRNPGYRLTNYCLVLCAIKILTEPSQLPKNGGVYPPGFVFAKTTLIDELHENGVTFDIMSEINN